MSRRIVRYFERTWRNKLCATVLVAIGLLTAGFIRDSTFLIFTLMIGIPLFISGENHIY